MSVYDKKLVQDAIESGRPNRTHLRVIQGVASAPGEMERPRTRADCVDGPRPCVFVGCKYNTFLDVSNAGEIKLNYGLLNADEAPPAISCVLDMAEHGGMTVAEIGEVLHVTRARIEQIEHAALVKARQTARGGPAQDFAGLRQSNHIVELVGDEVLTSGQRRGHSDAEYSAMDDGVGPEGRVRGAAWELDEGVFPDGSEELATDRVWAAYERGVEERKREGK